MKILTWNVNGVRAIYKKGFEEWLTNQDADIVCLQETKAHPDQLSRNVVHPEGYKGFWNSAEKKGYSGVATFSKYQPDDSATHFEKSEHMSSEWRIVETRFGSTVLLNIYFPNGGATASGEDRLPYKLEFYDHLTHYLNILTNDGYSTIVCGDFNVCHTEIDIARPKDNKNSIGFLPQEREKLDVLHNHGYIDAWRYYHPDTQDVYSWWSYRAGARPRNVGWRLDYMFVSQDLLSHIHKIAYQTDVMGSDHCPLMIDISLDFDAKPVDSDDPSQTSML